MGWDLDDAALDAIALGQAVVRDGLLGLVAAHAAAEAARLWRSNLRPAGIGRGAEHHLDPTVRGDAIGWLGDDAPAALVPVLDAFEALRQELNRRAWLSLQPPEVQLGRFPAGAHYARHRDAFTGPTSRRITAIYYLNPGWTSELGGQLRIFPPEGPREITPRFDRAVVFRADALEHEVLPTLADRWAITAWYR